MLAFCCQRQFSSTVDNMRQYGNTGQWIVADVTKPQVSKKKPAANKPQGFLNLGSDWQPIGGKSHTKKATNWKFSYTFIGNLCNTFGGLTAFIVSAARRVGYWSARRIEGRRKWPFAVNNKLPCKCICVRREEKREKWTRSLSFLSGSKQELTVAAGHHKSDFPYRSNCDRWTLQVRKQHIWAKKGRNEDAK